MREPTGSFVWVFVWVRLVVSSASAAESPTPSAVSSSSRMAAGGASSTPSSSSAPLLATPPSLPASEEAPLGADVSDFVGFELVAQGAEGRIFRGEFLGRPAILKQRFSKKYRHKELDDKLTRGRLLSEVRALGRCRKIGLRVPAVFFLDDARGLFIEEAVAGCTVRDFLFREDDEAARLDLARRLGAMIAQLHNAGMTHGDLTTSNFLVRDEDGALVMIDLGLATLANADEEDCAVDLYVLERAFVSTHPASEPLVRSVGERTLGRATRARRTPFDRLLVPLIRPQVAAVLEAYREVAVGGRETLKRLEVVRRRGRKRMAFG